VTTFSAETHEQDRVRYLAQSLVRLEQQATRAMYLGYVQEAADLWQQRDVIRERRSYLMRILWARRGITRRV
jgi:hypothetical protein